MSRALPSACTKGAPSAPLSLGTAEPDRILAGGLESAALHEIGPGGIFHLGAAAGFAFTLAIRNVRPGDILWVQQDFAHLEGGALYGLGAELFGIAPSRLLLVRARQPKDVLWAMEEGLRCSGISTVIAELGQSGEAADLTASRRLSLAAQSTGALGLLLRQHAHNSPSACTTRWRVSSAPGQVDRFGGIGRTAFRLELTKNRRGPCGDWILEWDSHAKTFTFPTLSVPVVQTAVHRPADTQKRRVA